ncbi:hypothetical protein HBA54_27710 [Pelagibius litoralis]|uniref:Uncharacterized protein n=1 Tax=Pelagibius litoralis TaxID=374515 RepID=A0A967F3F4_9PROT|nr:hypothetical protein [Pelagibius litoralis]NIA72380.1 hypothetical protein [Pelagibius litoralis]
MPDPVTLFTVGSTAVTLGDALAVVGTLAGVAGAVSGASADAGAAEFNEEQARIDAVQERDIAEQEAKDFRRRNSRILAASRARRAGSGVTSQGTPLLTDEATAAEIEFEAQNIIAGGANRSRALESEAAQQKAKARSSHSAGFIGAGTTLLTGAGSVFG